MSQDPNQYPSEYGAPQSPQDTPQTPYNNTGYGDQSNPYGGGVPQNPYENPQSPYPTPQNPYANPQNPYGAGPGYGDANQYGYNYNVPESHPLPLGEAIQQLPRQYIKVTTKPSPLPFAEEKGKASWDIIWIQLLGYAIISAILGYLSSLVTPISTSLGALGTRNPYTSEAAVQAITAASSFGSIIIVPLFFFIGQGILYLIAKAFKGEGSFLQQCYTALLFTVPLGILSGLLRFIPILGSLAIFAIGIYQIVLAVFSLMAVHRLSGGKATAVVLLPIAIAVVLACALGIVVALIAAAALQHAR